MKRFVVLNKEIGETPLMAINRWREVSGKDTPACYAGRLDPMASGKLLVLLGEECKRQERYHGLDKEYEIEVLFDVGSDTGDVLGIVSGSGKDTRITKEALTGIVKKELGRQMRAYPLFSSKTVNGKPLFLHALSGTLQEEVPIHEEHIFSICVLGITQHSANDLKQRIEGLLEKAPTSDEPSKALGADFRIKDVRSSWDALFSKTGNRAFSVARLVVTCGPGTYMRTLAGRIGEGLATKGLALSIRRTKIGRRKVGLWVKQY